MPLEAMDVVPIAFLPAGRGPGPTLRAGETERLAVGALRLLRAAVPVVTPVGTTLVARSSRGGGTRAARAGIVLALAPGVRRIGRPLALGGRLRLALPIPVQGRIPALITRTPVAPARLGMSVVPAVDIGG